MQLDRNLELAEGSFFRSLDFVILLSSFNLLDLPKPLEEKRMHEIERNPQHSTRC